MTMRLTAGVTALAFLLAQAPLPAWAQNAPRYTLLSERDVPRMIDNGGRLNIRVDNTRNFVLNNGQSIMLFRVGEVLPGSAFAGSGLVPGDEIAALNGYEFSDGPSFAAYVHSLSGPSRPMLDYIQHGSDHLIRLPALAAPQRGYADVPAKPRQDDSGNGVAGAVVVGVIGAGVLCWMVGCFSGSSSAGSASGNSGGGGGSGGGGSSYSPPPTSNAAAPSWPSVQGDVHGNLSTDIHGNGPRDVHGNPARDVQGNAW